MWNQCVKKFSEKLEKLNISERQVAKTNNIIEMLGITNVFKQRDAAEYFEKILCLTSPKASMLFKGELNHKTTCHGCNNKHDSKNFFWVLPLAIEDSYHRAFNVQQGLQRFFEVQTVCGDDQMFCTSCNKKKNADTECEMIQAPDVLTLLLKRFAFNYKKNCYVKLKCKADVAQTLHIQKCRYNLYAVVHHYGDLSGGHYTADIKSFETGQWYCFNDNVVKRVKLQNFEGEDNFLRSHTAYLLMYQKVSGQSTRTDSSDLKTHREHAGVLDKDRWDEAAVESCRVGNDKDLNCDGKALLRKQTSSCDKQFEQETGPVRQRGNILPPAVTEANGQQYGTKEHMYHLYTGGFLETTHPEWMLQQPPNYEIKRPKHVSLINQDNIITSGKNPHPSDHSPTMSKVKPAQPTAVINHWKPEVGVKIQGKTTKPRREACVSGGFKSHVEPHQVHSSTPSLPRRSRSLCRANDSSKCSSSPRLKSSSLTRNERTSQTVTKGKSERQKEKENCKKRENKDERKPWKY
ncbi:ubiquitin carboxyl-terminal hydrolase 26-like isoform X2 [Melanotaenia boesemani]|uniref:ubiquitin carboxyl-terminal hydrolase 26-like isoform X2 n=1 Tax=Melanotaenia boesemani TaxID=1250792 RepID=UPI001C03E0A4|nr:ubiquitin carboxyl-terminal hydrolase 26-like isoform X2 [Melanotaenia boesemani]